MNMIFSTLGVCFLLLSPIAYGETSEEALEKIFESMYRSNKYGEVNILNTIEEVVKREMKNMGGAYSTETYK